MLTPAEFGVYGITVFLMHFLVVFGDAGLAAGLVRESSEPEEEDYRAIFSFQQVLVAAVAVVGALAATWLPPLLLHEGSLGLLLPAALVALLLTSFQTTPAARLERSLDFSRLAVVEIGQALAFNAVAVGCALGGLGANSMAAALLARAATGAVAVQFVAPRALAWGWDWSRVRSRLRFGVSYQGAAFVNLIREALLPVFVGATLGSAAVGGIFFAKMLATYPLVLVYMLQRLLLPMFAHLQSNAGERRQAVEVSLFAVAIFVIPAQMAAFALQGPLTSIVFGEQWLGSLPVYRWLWLSVVLEPQLVVAISLLNAFGLAQRTLRFVVVTTATVWIAGAPLLLVVGPVGYGVAAALLLVAKWRLLREADVLAGASSLEIVAPVWAASSVGAVVAVALAQTGFVVGWWSLGASLTLSLVLSGAALFVLAPQRTRATVAWIPSWWRGASLSVGRSGSVVAREPEGLP